MSKNKRYLEPDEDTLTVGGFIKWFFWIALTVTICGFIGKGLGWFGSAATVVAQTIDPQTMLKKYEGFKDLASAIDKQKATILGYQDQLKDSTIDKDEKRQLRTEMRGIIASHNGLVSQYNADMAKANYAFCNAGQMPQSNLTPLPREYQEYITTQK